MEAEVTCWGDDLAARLSRAHLAQQRALAAEVMLPPGSVGAGAASTDQVRAIDQRTRILRRLGTAPAAVLAEARHRVATLIGLQASRFADPRR